VSVAWLISTPSLDNHYRFHITSCSPELLSLGNDLPDVFIIPTPTPENKRRPYDAIWMDLYEHTLLDETYDDHDQFPSRPSAGFHPPAPRASQHRTASMQVACSDDSHAP
jgi:hypothetical protein